MSDVNGIAFLGLATLLFGVFLLTAEHGQKKSDIIAQESVSWKMK